jgi:hypothetical protein
MMIETSRGGWSILGGAAIALAAIVLWRLIARGVI